MIEPQLIPAPDPLAARPAASSSQKLKHNLIFVLKLAIAIGALYYVVVTKVMPDPSRVPPEQLATAQEGLRRLTAMLTSPALMLAAIAAFSIQMIIGAQRLRVLLAPLGVKLSYLTALRLTYVGAFFDTFMITSVGGDFIKAYYLAKEAPKEHRVEAVSVLLLDRLMGLLGLLTLALTVAAFEYQKLAGKPEIPPWLIRAFVVVPCVLLVGTVMLLSETVYLSKPMQFMLRVLPMGAMLSRAYGALQQFRDRPAVLLKAFLLSIVVHLFGIVTGYILMAGGEFHASSLGDFAVALLICNFAVSFAPFGGIGTGQLVYGPLFKIIAQMDLGWVMATVMQAAILLAKAPGFIAWLLSRESRAPELAPSPELTAKS